MQFLSIKRKKRIYAIAFSPNGRELAAACGDDQLRVWDLTKGDVKQWVSIEHTDASLDIVYLDDNRLVFGGGELRCWDIGPNGWLVIEPRYRGNRHLAISPNNKFLAEVDDTNSTEWPGSGLFVYEIEQDDFRRMPVALESTINTTGGVAFTSDNKHLATGHIMRVGEKRRYFGYVPGGYAINDYDYIVHIREMTTGNIVQSIDGWQQGVRNLAFSPDNKYLAGTAGPRLRIWDLVNEREVAVNKRGTKHFQGLAFTADGRYLATVSNDETVRIWETNTWQEHTTFTWKIGALLNIALSPEGLRAAAGSDKGQIVIWDLDE
jgi:WD40 repeat protein